MKTINLAKVTLSPKWFVWAVLAMIILIILWQVSNWIVGKITGLTAGVKEEVVGGEW